MPLLAYLMGLLSAVTIGSFQPPPQSDAPAIERYALANGVRVLAVHVPGAERQCTFTFLPLSLATDPAGKSQWSHLLEHMVIRSTDSEGLMAGGVEFNGETQAHVMRLDTYSQPDSVRASFEKHARWLAADVFDGAVLNREQQVVASEEQSVAQSNYTHKFAVAGWNQIVRHGADHASVHADAAQAKIADVAAFARDALCVDESVLIATIGPVDPAAVRAGLEETIGRVAQRQPDAAIANASSQPPRSGELQHTWDLPVRHLMLWWRLPDDSPATRALVHTIEMAIMSRPSGPGAGPVLASGLYHLPEGPILLVNAALISGQNADAEHDRLTQLVNQIAGNPQHAASTAVNMARELASLPDFDAIRDTLPAISRAYFEANWLLGLAHLEYTWDQSLEEICAALGALDQASVAEVAGNLSRSPDGSLILTPRE